MRRLALGAVLLAMGAGDGWAQDQSRRVRAYLEHGMDAHESAGYERDRSVPDFIAPLELDRPHVWSVFLREGVHYRVYGACDDACSDLDMEIYGADGRLIERDVNRDDTPFVQLTPAQTGRHYVRVWLYACAAQSCYAAARVVSGGEPSPRGPEGSPQMEEQSPAHDTP